MEDNRVPAQTLHNLHCSSSAKQSLGIAEDIKGLGSWRRGEKENRRRRGGNTQRDTTDHKYWTIHCRHDNTVKIQEY